MMLSFSSLAVKGSMTEQVPALRRKTGCLPENSAWRRKNSRGHRQGHRLLLRRAEGAGSTFFHRPVRPGQNQAEVQASIDKDNPVSLAGNTHWGKGTDNRTSPCTVVAVRSTLPQPQRKAGDVSRRYCQVVCPTRLIFCYSGC